MFTIRKSRKKLLNVTNHSHQRRMADKTSKQVQDITNKYLAEKDMELINKLKVKRLMESEWV